MNRPDRCNSQARNGRSPGWKPAKSRLLTRTAVVAAVRMARKSELTFSKMEALRLVPMTKCLRLYEGDRKRSGGSIGSCHRNVRIKKDATGRENALIRLKAKIVFLFSNGKNQDKRGHDNMLLISHSASRGKTYH